jgi:ABC-type tungstate transport system permease subunit
MENEKQFITWEDEKNLEKNLEELTAKLGILDLREFIALNKFIIEGDKHTDIINKLKSKFLTEALERMDEAKAKETKKLLSV